MNIVLMTSNDHISANIAVRKFLENPFLKKKGIHIKAIVMTSPYEVDKKTWRKMKQFIDQSGWEFSIKSIALSIWKKLKIKFAKYFVSNKKRKYFEIEELAKRNHIPFLEVKNINSATCKRFLKRSKIDYLVSCFLLQIIDDEMLTIPIKGSINVHPAITQKHRGTFTSFWAIMNRWKKSGATVHYMTNQVDKGKVIIQKRFFVKKSDTIHCINEKSAKLGAKLLVKALIKLKRRENCGYWIKKTGRYFKMPHKKDIESFYAQGKGIIKAKDFFRA